MLIERRNLVKILPIVPNSLFTRGRYIYLLPSPDKVIIRRVPPMEANGGYSLAHWVSSGPHGDVKKPTIGSCNNGGLLHGSVRGGRAATVEKHR